MADDFGSNVRVGGGEGEGGGDGAFILSCYNIHFVTVFRFKNTFPLFFFPLSLP